MSSSSIYPRKFATYDKRLDSFTEEHSIRHAKEKVKCTASMANITSWVAQGFFYHPTTEIRWRMTCFLCGITVEDFTKKDDVTEYHYRVNPECPLVGWHRQVTKPQWISNVSTIWYTQINDLPYHIAYAHSRQAYDYRYEASKFCKFGVSPATTKQTRCKIALAGFSPVQLDDSEMLFHCMYCNTSFLSRDKDPAVWKDHFNIWKFHATICDFKGVKCFFLEHGIIGPHMSHLIPDAEDATHVDSTSHESSPETHSAPCDGDMEADEGTRLQSQN